MKKENNFILVLIFLISALALIPLLYQQFKVTPSNTFFTFAHNYIPDYYQYLSWMKDGADGKILITSRYSADNFDLPAGRQVRHPVYLFYSVLGWLTDRLTPIMARLPAGQAFGYTFARVFLGLLRLLVIYWFISLFFKKTSSRVLAFFLALFLPPFYNLQPFTLILPNLTSVDILQRTFFLPHDMATTILLLIGAVFFHLFLQDTQPLILSVIFFLIASIANPAMVMFFLIFFVAGSGLTFLQKADLRKKIFWGNLIILITSGLVLSYYQKLFATTLPFSWFINQQKMVRLTDFKGFFLLAGPGAILAIFGLPGLLKRKDFLANLIVSWAVVPFIIFPLLGKILPLSQERIFEMSIFLPLAILSAEAISHLKKRLRITLVIFLITGFSVPYLYLSIKNQIKSFAYPYFNVYIPTPTLEAFFWLDQNTPDESVVLSSYFTANMIPAFTHNKVFFGHDFVTYQAKDRLKDLAYIFDAQSDPSQIKKILTDYQVKYLFLSPESPRLESTNLAKIGLKSIFSNSQNQIYEFNF